MQIHALTVLTSLHLAAESVWLCDMSWDWSLVWLSGQ